MHICNFIEEGRYGGPQARITLVAEALKQYGVETHVVYSRYSSDKFRSKLKEEKISNTPLNITRLSREKKIFIRYIFSFLKDIYVLFSFFKKNQFDIIHVNGSPQIKGPIAAKIAGIPVVWHLNDTKQPAIVQKAFYYIARHCAKGFIVAGEKVYEYYLQNTALAEKPVAEIHAPVHTTLFNPEKATVDQRLLSCNMFKLLTICNISPDKGLDYYVEMAVLLNKQFKDISFFVGGPVYSSHERYFQRLKVHVNAQQVRNLTFLGSVNNVPAILKGTDIFVFCSLTEASPTVIWEAMAMGKAIVTTDVGSVNQYIEDGISGFIVPKRDPAMLAEKVKILIEDTALRERMGVEARAVAKARLDVSKAAEMHTEFYNQILTDCKTNHFGKL